MTSPALDALAPRSRDEYAAELRQKLGRVEARLARVAFLSEPGSAGRLAFLSEEAATMRRRLATLEQTDA